MKLRECLWWVSRRENRSQCRDRGSVIKKEEGERQGRKMTCRP